MKPARAALATSPATSPAALDAVFAALADTTRRQIIARLAGGPATVTELAAPLPMSQPAVSKHLKVLERAGLVTRTRDKTRRPARLEIAPLQEAAAWIAQYRAFWEDSFDRLDDLLVELQTAPQGPPDDGENGGGTREG